MAEFAGLPTGPYRSIVVDPPWRYGDKLPGGGRGAAKHYETMTVDEVAQLPVPDLADTDAHLYIWTTNAFMLDALVLTRRWGFSFKTIVTWVKTKKAAVAIPDAMDERDVAMGMGHYFRGATEHVVFATRGRLPAGSHSLKTVFFAPRLEHSRKPDVFYDMAAQMTPGPRLDMFARSSHSGYEAWGNEVQS